MSTMQGNKDLRKKRTLIFSYYHMRTITTDRIKSKCIMHAHATVEHEQNPTVQIHLLHDAASLCASK